MTEETCEHCGLRIVPMGSFNGEVEWIHHPKPGKDDLFEYCRLKRATPKVGE